MRQRDAGHTLRFTLSSEKQLPVFPALRTAFAAR